MHALKALWAATRRPIAAEWLALLAAVYFTLVANSAFWSAFTESASARASGGVALGIALAVGLTALHAALLILVVNRWTKPVVLPLVLLVTAAASFYMDRYQVYIDKDMVLNVLATERKEATELVTPGLVWAIVLKGLLPSLVVWRLASPQRSVARGTLRHAVGIALCLVTAAAAIGATLPAMSSLMRNEKALRHLITPGNWVVSLVRAVGDRHAEPAARAHIATDARIESSAGARPRLVVIVVGETVRASNWGLNGYARQTTPRLAALDGINYPDVEACGTNTEVSLPCLFSAQGLAHYDRGLIRGSESLLQLLDHLGVDTVWRDNQTGCKGICDGLTFQSFLHAEVPELCNERRCFDGVLLHQFPELLAGLEGDALVVLHMLGNHGPAYHDRYPEAFRRFRPDCESNELGDCSDAAIVNAYDNAILYTDTVVADAVALLEKEAAHRDVALLYVSDHGESLGESGLYLHGVPRMIAPDEQLKVPMWLWLSPQLVESDQVDPACLRKGAAVPRTHDAVFSTVLGLFRVQTAARDPALDLLAPCRRMGMPG